MSNKREKTIAVLLFAVLALSFMGTFVGAEFPWTTALSIKGLGSSNWVASHSNTGFYSVELISGTVVGDEGRIVVTFASGIPLSNLYTISWQVYTVFGYPPHVDVFLSSGNTLTAEMAVDQGMTILNIASSLPGGWVKTFERFPGDTGHEGIDSSTVFWVANLGAGTSDAPFGTLQNWKDNSGLSDPGADGIPDVSSDTILKLEFEVDSWVVSTKAYIDDIEVNGLDIMGVSGPVGPQGPIGPIGPAGATGATGLQGIQGVQGVQGDEGDEGADGATGPQGPEGDRGSRGLTGATGSQGLQGLDGPNGTAGAMGATGPAGSQGIQGVLGPRGVPGEDGADGLSGIGFQGVPGEQGATGDTGAKGDTGVQGATGATGLQGEPGPAIVVYGGAALGGISLLWLIATLLKKP